MKPDEYTWNLHKTHFLNFFLLERCPAGYVAFRKECYKLSAACGSFDNALQSCTQMGDKMVAPEDARENVLLSYLANQQSIHVAKTDRVQEGTWVRSGKMMIIVIWWQRKILVTHPKDCKLMKTPFLFLSRCLYRQQKLQIIHTFYINSTPISYDISFCHLLDSSDKSTYSRWANGEPSSANSLDDCAVQSGRASDFTESAESCSTCRSYVCSKSKLLIYFYLFILKLLECSRV